jgi:hypothetical protein
MHEPKDRSAEGIHAWLDEMEAYADQIIANAERRRKGGQSPDLRVRSARRLLENVHKYRAEFDLASDRGLPALNFEWIERTIHEVRLEAEDRARHMRKDERGGV